MHNPLLPMGSTLSQFNLISLLKLIVPCSNVFFFLVNVRLLYNATPLHRICGGFKFVFCKKTFVFQGLIKFFLYVRYLFILNHALQLPFSPISRNVLEVETQTPQFNAKWRCKLFHRVVISHFTITRHNFFDYRRSEVNAGILWRAPWLSVLNMAHWMLHWLNMISLLKKCNTHHLKCFLGNKK